MSFIADDVYAAALAVLGEAEILHIASKQASSIEELAVVSLGFSPVRFMRSSRTLTVLPIRDGAVTNNGRATHFALVRNGKVVASSELEQSRVVGIGNAFELSRFDIDFPG